MNNYENLFYKKQPQQQRLNFSFSKFPYILLFSDNDINSGVYG